MTMVTISSENPRSIKAIEIAAGAGQWLKRHARDGAKKFGIPSRCARGRYYLVDSQTCDCEDFRRHGLSNNRLGMAGEHRPCKHILAVVFLRVSKSGAAEEAKACTSHKW